MRKIVVHAWNYVFNHEISPLRHIPDVAVRHMVLQILGWMWAVAFSITIGSYVVLGVSLMAHIFLFAAAAITVATYTTASSRPKVFTGVLGRRSDGEHD